MTRTMIAAPLFLVALLTAANASATHVSLSTGGNVEFDGDQVVITPKAGPPAEISPAGEFTIDGRRIAVSEKDRILFGRYNQSMHRIVAEAKDIGLEGASLGLSALGQALAAIFTGDGEAVERKMKAKAEPLKERGRELCREVKGLQRIQHDLAADVPEFRPYATLDADEPHCDMDD